MTKSERKILSLLGWGNPPVPQWQLRRQARLSVAGMPRVIGRMVAANLVAVSHVGEHRLAVVELTYGGHRLKEREAI